MSVKTLRNVGNGIRLRLSTEVSIIVEHIVETEISGLDLWITSLPGPDYLTTKGLQKGLVLYLEGKPLVQEGIGFGVPILRTSTDTFFSHTATLNIQSNRITKTYEMDTVSRVKIKGMTLKNKLLRYIFESQVALYMSSSHLQPLMLNMQRLMARALEASCVFDAVASLGKVDVEYTFRKGKIHVRARFNVRLENARYIMANEQGADFFDRALIDTRKFESTQLRGWMKVQDAKFVSSSNGLWFSVHPSSQYQLFLGREKTEYLCWSGINIQSNSPRIDYHIMLERG